MMNCHEITRLISESQERPLALKERMALKMHVMMCSGCRNFGRQMHTIRHVARAYTRGEDVGSAEKAE
ncbi:MAG: zf-HC2 domain-containing protein [Pseudomonadota bacterium]